MSIDSLLFGTYAIYLNIISSLLKTLLVGLLGAIWIKYSDKTAIGMKASFKVVGIVFIIGILFTFAFQVLQQKLNMISLPI